MLSAIVVLYLFLGYVEAKNQPVEGPDGLLMPSENGILYELAKFAQTATAFVIAVCLPWLLIALTFPKTFGTFVNERFNTAFAVMGADTMNGNQYGELAMPEGVPKPSLANAKVLDRQMTALLKIYFLFVAAELVAWLSVV